MDLWNAVEKDKVVQAARRSAAARNRTRLDPSQPPVKKVGVHFPPSPPLSPSTPSLTDTIKTVFAAS